MSEIYTAPHQSERKWQTNIPPARDDRTKYRSARACIILASQALDSTEVQVPWEYLTNHGFFVEFATWDGKPAEADKTLLNHIVWGSKYSTQAKWKELITLTEWETPHAWAPAAQSGTPFTLDSYDLVYIPGGWAARECLEKDVKLQAILGSYTLHIQRSVGAKVLAVSGDGIAPLLSVTHPLTHMPVLTLLTSTGPGYDTLTGVFTGSDLGSQIPKLVKSYTSRSVVFDPVNWYISAPSSAYATDLCAGMVSLTRHAIKVDTIRKSQSPRLTTAESQQLLQSLEFTGLTTRQKERMNSDGIGVRDTGFALSQWSWGWKSSIK